MTAVECDLLATAANTVSCCYSCLVLQRVTFVPSIYRMQLDFSLTDSLIAPVLCTETAATVGDGDVRIV